MLMTAAYQADFHMGPKTTGFHPWRMPFRAFKDQLLINPFGFSRGGGRTEAGTQAAAGIRGQGELADQQPAPDSVEP